jgi:hypothetical protein
MIASRVIDVPAGGLNFSYKFPRVGPCARTGDGDQLFRLKTTSRFD